MSDQSPVIRVIRVQQSGTQGAPGASTYQLAVFNGYEGTLEEWLAREEENVAFAAEVRELLEPHLPAIDTVAGKAAAVQAVADNSTAIQITSDNMPAVLAVPGKAAEVEAGRVAVAANLQAAELARDAALTVAGPLYPDEPTGRAAVADGAFFRVAGFGDVAAIVYRRASATESQFRASVPSADRVARTTSRARASRLYGGDDVAPLLPVDAAGGQTLSLKLSDGSIFGVVWDRIRLLSRKAPRVRAYTGDDYLPLLPTDARGGQMLSFKLSDWSLVGVVWDRILAPLQKVGGRLGRLRGYSGSDLYPILADAQGGAVLAYDRVTGRAVGALVDQLSAGAASSSVAGITIPLASDQRPARTAWNGFIAYGQSLSIGALSVPPLSLAQPYGNLTFGAGPKASKAGNTHGGLNPGTDTVKPLVEDTAWADVANRGETICSQAANCAVERSAVLQGVAPADLVIFASAAGKGSQPIAALSKGAAWYQQFIDHVSEAKARATAAGKSYALHGVAWMQGEADTDGAAYLPALQTLINDINTDVLAITGQTTPVHMLIYQTASYAVSRAGAVQLAQYRAVKAHPRIHFATPIYHVLYTGDGIHLTNIGTWRVGRAFGRAYQQLVVEGRKPDCIWPVSAVVRGLKLRVRFRVPQTPLVLDTDALGAATDHGFRVQDDTGQIALSAIRIVDGDTVEATLGRPCDANPRIRYGLDYLGSGLNINGGASGNLRDSTTDTSTLGGTVYNDWHWSPAFEEPIIKLEA